MTARPDWGRVAVRGVGMSLPGIGDTCRDLWEFTEMIMKGVCAISEFDEFDTPLRVAGQVPDSGAGSLGLPDRALRRLPKASRLAHVAVADAIGHAGLTAADLNDTDAVLVVASIQFGLRETADLLRRFHEAGPRGIGLDYWIAGTPGSIAGCLATNLGLDMPTLTLTGGCSTSLRAFELAAGMIARGEVEHAVVVGTDCVLEPLFLSSTTYEGGSGFRASTLSGDPEDVRPHDDDQTGNAPGEGAVAWC
ncbi:beta-ketoacyl synthase N-terminal-like domain-containing protein [Allosalinactinospora lopnorensis]|uniref:beta-ketoacyl synthase N-terminal-like domain-containing protein n=1 Tax=Allosalinactinospora lopnorensis TaxID=1352348 RepID=UPI00069743CA|nr:beta-ketoacyl synthase N-terminal-like domain-containing protein [Allosalinactinospora lopnorensis]